MASSNHRDCRCCEMPSVRRDIIQEASLNCKTHLEAERGLCPVGGGLPWKHLISAVSPLHPRVSEELRRGKECRDEQTARTAFLTNLLRIYGKKSVFAEMICKNTKCGLRNYRSEIMTA